MEILAKAANDTTEGHGANWMTNVSAIRRKGIH